MQSADGLRPMSNGTEGTHSALVISKLLSMTPRRLQQLSKEGYIPKSSRGKYTITGSVQGYIRYLKAREKKSSGPAGDHEIDSLHPRDRYMHYKAELAERELRLRDGELYLASETNRTISTLFKAVTATLDSIPDVLERDCGLSPDDIHPVFITIDMLRESIISAVNDVIRKEEET